MYMTTALASRLTHARMMHAIGQLEIWCGMFMLISLAGEIYMYLEDHAHTRVCVCVCVCGVYICSHTDIDACDR